MAHLPAVTEWLDGVRVTELRMTAVADGWRVMLKGYQRDRPVVAFVYADAWRDALTLVATTADSGHLTWFPDRFPAKG